MIQPRVRRGKEIRSDYKSKNKEILHLPSWISTDWIHSKSLGLTELQSNTVIARKKASEKMLLSSDKISQTVASEIDPMNDERLEGLRLHNLQPNKRKTTWAERRFENLAKINNGKAIGRWC